MRSQEFPRNPGLPDVMVVEPSDQVIQQEVPEQETIRGHGLRTAHPESTATIATATIIRRTVNRTRGIRIIGAPKG